MTKSNWQRWAAADEFAKRRGAYGFRSSMEKILWRGMI